MFPFPMPPSPPPSEPWVQSEALELAVKLEEVLSVVGWHVALTGGCLYKEAQRKDADFIVYRNDMSVEPNQITIIDAIRNVGLVCNAAYARVLKCTYGSKSVDIIMPELAGEYQQ